MVTLKSHPTTNAIITPSANNPEWGTVRLESEQTTFANNVMNKSTRCAFIRGEIKNLEQVFKKVGQTFPGKIIYKQSFEPMYEGHKAKINPRTQELVLTDGKPTYFESVYTEDSSAVDYWVKQTVEAPANLQENLQEQAV